MKKAKRVIVWFRKDLRLHDNEALCKALENGIEVIPVYVFDQEELLGETEFGFQKTGKHRAKFILETIAELRQSFQDLGIDLITRFGKPEEEVFELVKETEATLVYANMERTQDEVLVQNALEKKLWSIGLEIHFFRGKMLYHTQDLPFPIAHTPDSFNIFKKEVERFVPVRTPFEEPTSFEPWTIKIENGTLPTLENLGHRAFEKDERGVVSFQGGEQFALNRIHTFLGEDQLVENYNKQHGNITGLNNTAKISAWLALGSLSPKYVYAELKSYEKRFKVNKSTQDFFMELLSRDYYRLLGKKYGDRIFEKGGLLGKETKDLDYNEHALDAWINGHTNSPFINACMIELKQTGYLSPKGRLLVSSYLVYELNVNWRMGAAYFQHILIDYDVCSNWVNWNVVGGVGVDPKEDRQFNIENQSKKLDPHQEFTTRWLSDTLQGV